MQNQPGTATPAFLPKVIEFSDGVSYELLNPLTDYRKCHDGTPLESRIVFICRQNAPVDRSEELVIKIKVQEPDATSSVVAGGPSTTTLAELEVLEKFRDIDSPYTPHLVNKLQVVQEANGPLPGGYISFTVMTKMPGVSLLNSQYWNKTAQERELIQDEFMRALKWITAAGVEPLDCGLRNVMWEPETKKCSIIDFELWRPASGPVRDRVQQLQRWALASRPPSRDWWTEWNRQTR